LRIEPGTGTCDVSWETQWKNHGIMIGTSMEDVSWEKHHLFLRLERTVIGKHVGKSMNIIDFANIFDANSRLHG